MRVGSFDLSENGQIVLFTGGVRNPIKRVGLAQGVLKLLGKQGMDVRLLIANGVQPDRMPLYLNASDALLLTSIREGSPTIVKEALARNLPIVSVDVGDVRERRSLMAAVWFRELTRDCRSARKGCCHQPA